MNYWYECFLLDLYVRWFAPRNAKSGKIDFGWFASGSARRTFANKLKQHGLKISETVILYMLPRVIANYTKVSVNSGNQDIYRLSCMFEDCVVKDLPPQVWWHAAKNGVVFNWELFEHKKHTSQIEAKEILDELGIPTLMLLKCNELTIDYVIEILNKCYIHNYSLTPIDAKLLKHRLSLGKVSRDRLMELIEFLQKIDGFKHVFLFNCVSWVYKYDDVKRLVDNYKWGKEITQLFFRVIVRKVQDLITQSCSGRKFQVVESLTQEEFDNFSTEVKNQLIDYSGMLKKLYSTHTPNSRAYYAMDNLFKLTGMENSQDDVKSLT